MPPKYKKAKKAKRAKRSNAVSGVPTGIPTQRTSKLTYNQRVSIASTSGILNYTRFRLTSLFDPWYESGGHQPYPFDQMAQFYQHYIVTGAKVKIKPMNINNLAGAHLCGSFIHSTFNAPYTISGTYIEAKKGPYRVLGPNSNMNITPLQVAYNAKQYFNLSDIKDNLDRLGASTGDDPAEDVILFIWFETQDGSTSTYYFDVTIEYTAIFSEPKALAAS